MAMKLYGTDPNLPNFARPEYVASVPDLTLIADEMAGTRAMHAESKKYIRKWSGEEPDTYNVRRVCESFFEGLGRTLSSAIGMLFAKAPVIDWNQAEAQMKPDWENIDGAGTKGDVFVKRHADMSIRDGIGVLFVDHTPQPRDVPVNARTETSLFLRPVWSGYSRLACINWDEAIIDGQKVLTMLTFAEIRTRRDGLYGTKAVQLYRVLQVVNGVAGWTLHEQTDEAGDKREHFRVVGSGIFRSRSGQTRSSLPVAIDYTGRTDGLMSSTIPLLGVAWANLGHWQLSTDLRFNSEVAGFSQPVVIGEMAKSPDGTEKKLGIGPLNYVHVGTGGDYKWAGPGVEGIKNLAELVAEKLQQMAALGVSFLQRDTRAAETAEAKRLDATAENATLATAAQGIEDTVNQALEIHAWYLDIPKEQAPTIRISRDFEDTTMSADVMRAYIEAMKAGLPARVVVKAFQAGGRVDDDEDADALAAEMEETKLVNDLLAAEQERQALKGAEDQADGFAA